MSAVPADPAAPLSADEIGAQGDPAAPEHSVLIGQPVPSRLPRSPFGEPDRRSLYHTEDGQLYGIVVRWDATPDRKKEIRPCVFTGEKWEWKGFLAGCPLYHAELLSAQPVSPVLIVSGEKTADAAPAYLADDWIVVTWQGGDSAWSKTNWQPLMGHRCVIWPDNDTSGWQAGMAIMLHLQGIGIECAMVPKIRQLPEKWDLADELPDGVTPDSIRSVISRTFERAFVPSEEPTASNVVPLPGKRKPREQVDLEKEEFQPLGFNNQVFFFLGKASQQIHEVTASQMTKRETMLQLMPDFAWWAAKYGTGDSGAVPWPMIGAELMSRCYKVGVFLPDKIRGRGAWLDDKRIVVHVGDRLLVDGTPFNPVAIPSKFIYPKSTPMVEVDGVEPLDREGAKKLRALCNLPLWDNRISGDLLFGTLATSTVCGALRWRNHLWLTGSSGAGKSHVLYEICGRALGDLAIRPTGATTEPAIRRALGGDARPVLYDEAEARGPAGVMRRDAILELMRQSSSEGGKILKAASSDAGTVEFSIRSQFILASIGTGLREAADETRTILLSLRGQNAVTQEQREAQSIHFRKLLKAESEIGDDFPARLFLRMVSLIPELRQNVEIFSAAIAATLGNRRLGDLMGTPLAGCWTLLNGSVIDEETVKSYIAAFDWSEMTRSKAVREDYEIINYLSSHTLRVLLRSNATQERAIGEIIAVAARKQDDDGGLRLREAHEVLIRHGIRLSDDNKWVMLSNSHPKLREILQKSDYPQGFMQILQKSPVAKVSGKNVRIGGVSAWATMIPIAEFTDAKPEPELEPPPDIEYGESREF